MDATPVSSWSHLAWIPGVVNIPRGRLGPKCFSYRVFEGGLTQEERYLEESKGGWLERNSELFNNKQAPWGEH